MKKLIIICLLLITTFALNAQTFTAYVDDTERIGLGFAYNVTFRVTLLRMAEKGDVNRGPHGTEYSVELVKVDLDKNKGWYERGKIHKCEQLEGICNTKTYRWIGTSLTFNCEGKELRSNGAVFHNIGDKVIMDLEPHSIGNSTCYSPTVSGIDNTYVDDIDIASRILSIIAKNTLAEQGGKNSNPLVNEANPSNSSSVSNGDLNNPLGTNQSTATSTTTTETPNNNLKYSDFGIPENTPTYTKSQLREQVVTQAAGLVGQLLNGWAEDAREKEAYEVQRREEQAERDRIAAEIRLQKEQKIAEHTNYITVIKDAKLPLSSSDIEEDVVYYYAFSADKSALATINPTIKLSNVFPIAKYNDGTWPYTVNIKKELSTVLKTSDVVLNGYFKSESEAVSNYLVFKESLEKLDFIITPIVYKGKIKETTSSDNSSEKAVNKTDDFWGDSSNKVNKIDNTTQPKQVQTAPVKNTPTKAQSGDFWNN